jgi:multiple sugar transport system ATP-binding protein
LGGVPEGAASAIVGVRPENVEIGSGTPPAGALASRVYLVEPTGAETWVTVELGDERVTARAPASFAGRSGDAAWLRVDIGRATFFDSATQARLAVDGAP